MDPIKMWENAISGYKHLSYREAKQLHFEIENEQNPALKELKRQQLINGTMHVVLKFIKKSKNLYGLFQENGNDLDDIISTLYEIWIKEIDSPNFRNKISYGHITFSLLPRRLAKELTTESYYSYTLFDNEEYGHALYEFLHQPNCLTMTYNEFEQLFSEKYKFKEKCEPRFYDSCLLNTFKQFRDIASKTKELDISIEDLNKGTVEAYRNPLAESASNRDLDVEDVYYDFEENFLQNERNEQLLLAINSAIKTLTPIEEFIITRRMGLDGEYPTIRWELAKELGVTQERILEIERKAMRKLKTNARLEYRRMYNEPYYDMKLERYSKDNSLNGIEKRNTVHL